MAGIPLAEGSLLGQVLGAGGSVAFTYIVSFVIALGVLIFIHELGHFMVAKAVGVGVERFSLGFGPRLWSMRRGETEYCVSLIPLGGYVKMVGEEASGEEAIHPETPAAADAQADPPRSFALKPLWARALIVFAGPGMNLVLAAVIFSAIFTVVGIPVFPTTVGRVLPESPAAQAELQPGDEIVAVNGVPLRHWAQLDEQVARSEGRPLRLTVKHGGAARDVAGVAAEIEREGFARGLAEHLVRLFGSEAPAIVRLAHADPALKRPIVPGHPAIRAELVHAIRREMAVTLSDLLVRRTHVFYETQGHAVAEAADLVELAAAHLNWDPARQAMELTAYLQEVERSIAFRAELSATPA